jgi:hypothetical protein
VFVLLFYVKLEQDLTKFDEVERCKLMLYIYNIIIIIIVVVVCSNVLCFFKYICPPRKKVLHRLSLVFALYFFLSFSQPPILPKKRRTLEQKSETVGRVGLQGIFLF